LPDVRTLFLYIFPCFLLLAVSPFLRAQEIPVEEIAPPVAADSSGTMEDSVGYYDEDYDEEDILYFTAKDDTTALYDSSLLVLRSVPDTAIQRLKHDDAFWYADKDMQQKKKVEKKNTASWWERLLVGLLAFLGNPAVRQILFYCIIFLLVLAAAWFLINNEMSVFGKPRKRIPAAGKPDAGGEDILETDLEGALKAAELEKDYRLAVRIQYLILLRSLSGSQLIQYRDDATNMEYLSQVYGKSFYPQFFTLTRHYEYVWYGEAMVTEGIYQRLSQDFKNLNQTVETA